MRTLQTGPQRPVGRGKCSLLLLLLLLLAAPGWAAGRQAVRAGLPPGLANLKLTGDLPATNQLRLAIGLPLRNAEALDALLRNLYDPRHPLYRRYLTPAEFTEQFGPTEQDYQAVADFAEAQGLTVTLRHSNRLVLDVAGSPAAIKKAFGVTMRVYQHPVESRTFYAPDAAPSVDLVVPILDISGLDDYSRPKPNHKRRPIAPVATPNAGSGPGGSYRGNDFRAAYVPGTTLTGAGQSVGLLQFDGFYAADIATYASQIGLNPAPQVVVVPVDGGVATPGNGNSEVALDIEMVMSMSPGVSTIYVYEAPNPSPWVDLLNAMVANTSVKQFSCSWGGGSANASAEQIFKQMAAQGQSFFNASGDYDAFTSAVSFPADSTNITQVGGTTLSTTGPGGAYVSETVWNWGLVNGNYVGSSGGVSTYYGIPGYQLGIDMTANQGSTTMRNIPDVALTGDNVYVVYDNGSTGAFGGTSCAAPLWAGFTALVNQQAAALARPSVGFLNRAMYSIGKGPNFNSCFHDITTGNNFSSSSPTKYAAVAGYDLCTGWGTPNGTNLINALAYQVLLSTNTATLVAESFLPVNAAIDPGETIVVNLALVNLGTVNTSNLVATLLAGGGVTSPGPAQTYGVVVAQGPAVAMPFSFTATGTCGGIVSATLELRDGSANLGSAVFNLRLGTFVSPLRQSFDAVSAPALPAGWTTSTSNAQPLWVTSAASSDTTPNAAFTSGTTAVGINELVSPSFPVTTSSAQLSFRNNYNLESSAITGRDGGVLEISIGSGAFADILSAGGSFVSGGYVRSLGTTRGNPLGGRQAWCGNSGGFITTLVNLPAAAAGQNVRLKWRCGTDNRNASVGWYIDSILVADGSAYVCYSPSADLAISQSALPVPVVVGSNLTYTLIVTNLGPLDADTVLITNTLPAGTTFVSASPGLSYSAGCVTGSLGTISNAIRTNLSITVQVAAPGSLTNSVSISSATADPVPGNNVSTLLTTALSPPQILVAPPALDFGYAVAGQSVTQYWKVVNTGQAALTGSAAGSGVFFAVPPGSFAVGGGQTGLVAVAFSPVGEAPYAGSILFTSNGGNSTNSVTGTGAFLPSAGFTLSPTNGLAPLPVTFSDTSTGTITNRTWDFGDGASTNTTAVALSHTYLAATNTVTLTVRGPLGSSTNSRVAAVIATNLPVFANLAVSLVASPDPVFSGRTLTCALAVANAGPQPASNVILTNTLPSQALLGSVTATQGGWTNYGQDVVISLGSLSNGALASIVITMTPSVLSNIMALTNVAIVSAAEADPNPSNNTATVVSTAWLDSVGDGIPNWWRAQYFGTGESTNSLSCATCDPDVDGFNNRAEYTADTDPTNSFSRLVFTGLATDPAGLVINWRGGTAARQFLQVRTNLFTPGESWMDLLTNDPPTPIFNTFTNAPGTSATRFFRLRGIRP